jgi:hypothetical protein
MTYRGPRFLRPLNSAPRPPSPSPLSRQLLVSLSLSSCVSPVELTDGNVWGRGWARSQIIQPRESLALYKSFNTFIKTNVYTSHVALARATNKADTKDLKSLNTRPN